MQPTIRNRTIFCNDNLEILQGINSNSIDLVYLDPPFNKNKVFTAPIGSSAEGASFRDIFTKEDVKEEWFLSIGEDSLNTAIGKEVRKRKHSLYNLLNFAREAEGRTSYNFCYLSYMSIRLIEMHRVLKSSGGIYLHCDPTMSHYLKLALDCIFGEDNFRNEIVWQRNDGRAKGSQHESKKFGSNTDHILFYGKSPLHIPNVSRCLTDSEASEKFNKVDASGRRYYTGIPLFRSESMGARPNLCFEWRGFRNPHPSGWRLSKERLEEEYQSGNIVIRGDGKLERRKYADEYDGQPMDNNWTDIPRLTSRSDEYMGYPTQKPIELLERIIRASCPVDGLVLDPFCGCATTCVAAEKLKVQWIGIDISQKAYELVKKRITKEVVRPHELGFDVEKEVHFKTTPPKRTDLGLGYQEMKYVYIISHENYPNEYKVGIAQNWKLRLNSYQTGDPDRKYKVEFTLHTPHYSEIEKHIHKTFENKHEWVSGNLQDIQRAIENYKPSEYASNEQSELFVAERGADT